MLSEPQNGGIPPLAFRRANRELQLAPALRQFAVQLVAGRNPSGGHSKPRWGGGCGPLRGHSGASSRPIGGQASVALTLELRAVFVREIVGFLWVPLEV